MRTHAGAAFNGQCLFLIAHLRFIYCCDSFFSVSQLFFFISCFFNLNTFFSLNLHSLVMVVSLVYLSLVHLHRIYFDYGSYTLDITGPLMVITQKVTLLTFSIHDGIARNENELTKSQKFHAIRTLPTALEYFAYMLHFQGLMAGPLVFYKDYIEFIEGKNFLKHASANVSILISYFLHINNSYVSLSIYYSGYAVHYFCTSSVFLFFPFFSLLCDI